MQVQVGALFSCLLDCSKEKIIYLKTFRLQVHNISSTYNTPQAEQLLVVKNWLGCKGLQFLEALTNEEKCACNPLEGLFEILMNKFKPQFNETIKSLQFYKLSRQDGESAEEFLGRLRSSTVECNCQEVDRQLKEQFIHGLNDMEMLGKIIREITKVKVNNTINSETVLVWTKRVEAQRVQAAVMSSITETKELTE